MDEVNEAQHEEIKSNGRVAGSSYFGIHKILKLKTLKTAARSDGLTIETK